MNRLESFCWKAKRKKSRSHQKEDVSGAVKTTTAIIQSWLKTTGTLHTYRYLIECIRKAGIGAFAELLESKMMLTCHVDHC